MPERCPICGNPFSQSLLHQGFIYCSEGHVLTVAPLYAIDPRCLRAFASSAHTSVKLHGGDPDERGVSLWRALL